MTELERKNKEHISRQVIFKLFLWLLLFLLSWSAFVKLGEIKTACGSYSLRFSNGISEQAALEARRYAVKNNEKYSFLPSFWREDYVQFSSDLQKCGTKLISYSGDGALVYPNADFISGGFGGGENEGSCVVSSTLAWQLWGSLDVRGKTLEHDGRQYVVGGVFKHEESLAIAGFGMNGHPLGWQAAEIDSNGGKLSYADAKVFAQASGLGMADGAQSSYAIALFCSALAFFPAIIIAVFYFCRSVALWLRNKSSVFKYSLLFGALLIFAFCLPFILNALPPALLPKQWSDFSFFSSLAGQAKQQISEFMQIAVKTKDAELRFMLLGLFFNFAACAVLAVICLSCASVAKPRQSICNKQSY